MSDVLLHVLTPGEREQAERAGLRVRPGGEPFLHLCRRDQLDGVLERFFAGAGELDVLELDPGGLDVVVEAAPDGAGDFPHLYGDLPWSAVRRVRRITVR